MQSTLLIMASDLDIMYFSVVNTSHWHWMTCLVKSLIHDACIIFVWAEELSRHTVVLRVCLSCSCLNVIFCFFPGGDFSAGDIYTEFTVCVMIDVSIDISLFFISVFICVLFLLFFLFVFICVLCVRFS